MDFTLTEEQQMLLDTTRRFVAKEYSFEKRRQITQAPEGFSRTAWQGLADIGLLSLNIPEEEGGLGGNAVDTMLAMNVIGEGLLLEPYLTSSVLASKMITLLGNTEQRAGLLPALAAGEKIAALAHDEPSTRFDRLNIETRAWPMGDGYVVTGHKSVVMHGFTADMLLITARIVSVNGQDHLAAFIVAPDAAGVRQVPYKTADGIPASDIWLNQVFIPSSALLDHGVDATMQLEQVLDAGIAAICAEAVGALDKLLAATVEYARNRKQFGMPIGKFQALQHRMADMVLHIEQARSMSYLAAVRCMDNDPAVRRAALSAAKVVIGQACRFVGQQAVQLHGGMGVTDELDVSHYFKRLMAIEMQFGSTEHHLEQYASQLA